MPEAGRARARTGRTTDGARQQHAYAAIKRDILDATYPAGTPLSEYALARDIGVSRTPVREALKRLQQEGLVRSVARRGTFVSELRVEDVIEIYEIRDQLESLAATLAAARMDKPAARELRDRIDEVRRAARDRRVALARQEDLRLHKEIIAATGNARLTGILSTLDDQVHRIRALALSSEARISATLVEHAAIVDAIIKGDGVAAGRAMRAHLRVARDNAVRLALGGKQLDIARPA